MLAVANSPTHCKLSINHSFNNEAIALNSLALVVSRWRVVDTELLERIVFPDYCANGIA